MIIIKKYKDDYVFKTARDVNGKIYNPDDNYICCRAQGQIWRFNSDTLVFESPHKIKLTKVDKETNVVIYDYTDLVLSVIDTDEERIISFKEENFDKLKDLFKVRSKRKLSEEAKLAAKIRLAEFRKNKGIITELNEEDLEEELSKIDEDIESIECEE